MLLVVKYVIKNGNQEFTHGLMDFTSKLGGCIPFMMNYVLPFDESISNNQPKKCWCPCHKSLNPLLIAKLVYIYFL